ncbi:MAG: 50S ribosomal protein L4 [Clostridia bacterium]
MIEIKVVNTKAEEVGKIEVPKAVFGQEYNEPLIHQVIVAQLANKRQGTKSTLTRTEVRGGGAKPWRQKGTGRARHGSIRAPQWTKGGVVFAPKPRDFSKKVNRKMKAAAMRSALSRKLSDGDFLVVDKFELAEPKTKLVAGILNTLGANKKTLLVLNGDYSDVFRASRNIQDLAVYDAPLLNVYEVVRAGKVIITQDAIKTLTEVYAHESI